MESPNQPQELAIGSEIIVVIIPIDSNHHVWQFLVNSILLKALWHKFPYLEVSNQPQGSAIGSKMILIIVPLNSDLEILTFHTCSTTFICFKIFDSLFGMAKWSFQNFFKPLKCDIWSCLTIALMPIDLWCIRLIFSTILKFGLKPVHKLKFCAFSHQARRVRVAWFDWCDSFIGRVG